MGRRAPTHASRTQGSKLSIGFVIGMLLVALCLIVAGAAIVYGVTQDSNPIEAAQSIAHDVKRTLFRDAEKPPQSAREPLAVADKPAVVSDKPASARDSSEESESSSKNALPTAPREPQLPTPVIAEYGGILIHSPIEASCVYAILFHQASYPWALVLDSKLPELDADVVFETHKIDIPANQPTGDVYMNAGALHVWRVGESTPIDTSIDVGAAPGSTVYAPVTGEVILVSEYDLYDICKDYEVHIQPEGFDDLDCVVIHIKDVCVKEGDQVVAGVSPIAAVRDIASEGVDGIHLAQFSDKEDGNHAHVQINDMNYEGYRKAKFESSSSSSEQQSSSTAYRSDDSALEALPEPDAYAASQEPQED